MKAIFSKLCLSPFFEVSGRSLPRRPKVLVLKIGYILILYLDIIREKINYSLLINYPRVDLDLLLLLLF